MPLSAGTRLGPFEILAPLGEGGMGEVYRASDARLNREVALKVVPDAFAHDTDRLAPRALAHSLLMDAGWRTWLWRVHVDALSSAASSQSQWRKRMGD